MYAAKINMTTANSPRPGHGVVVVVAGGEVVVVVVVGCCVVVVVAGVVTSVVVVVVVVVVDVVVVAVVVVVVVADGVPQLIPKYIVRSCVTVSPMLETANGGENPTIV